MPANVDPDCAVIAADKCAVYPIAVTHDYSVCTEQKPCCQQQPKDALIQNMTSRYLAFY